MMQDDDLRIRPGRTRQGRKPQSFMAEVMRAAKKAGHIGNNIGRSSRSGGGSSAGRGRRAARSFRPASTARRVVIKSRIVRHQGTRFRAAPLSKHMAYLKRDGVTRDGADTRMFDARSDAANERAFAERTADDRHHFRFIVSPEDATELKDLRAYGRTLMAGMEQDLGTKLDWVAVDHFNTGHPHSHIVLRGKDDKGDDLVIAREYIASALLRSKPAESCTPHSRAVPNITCCSSSVTNGLGARLSSAIKSRQLVFATLSGILPFLPAAAQASMVLPVIAAT